MQGSIEKDKAELQKQIYLLVCSWTLLISSLLINSLSIIIIFFNIFNYFHIFFAMLIINKNDHSFVKTKNIYLFVCWFVFFFISSLVSVIWLDQCILSLSMGLCSWEQNHDIIPQFWCWKKSWVIHFFDHVICETHT